MDSSFPIRIPYGELDDVAELLEDLAQIDVGEVTEHKANLLGAAQNLSVRLRYLMSEQSRCPKHVWRDMPSVLRLRYFEEDIDQFCKLCGDLK